MDSSNVKKDSILLNSNRENIRTKSILRQTRFSETKSSDNAYENNWNKPTNSIKRERKKSWKLIDGEIDEISWSSNDGCRKWLKRLLTIGNILVITTSICILFSSSYFCIRR